MLVGWDWFAMLMDFMHTVSVVLRVFPLAINMFNVVIICSSRTILSSRSGYATTNAKYIILVEDVIPPDDIQLEKTRENELKILLVSKHSETYETSSETNDSIYSVYSHQYMGFTQTIF
jgi:hypothetical protein